MMMFGAVVGAVEAAGSPLNSGAKKSLMIRRNFVRCRFAVLFLRLRQTFGTDLFPR
ncbi:hypothetical protein ACNKHT_18940 [Shigella flexneri]